MNADDSSDAMAAARSKPEPPKPGATTGPSEFFLLRRREAEARQRVYVSGDPGFGAFELGLAALRDGNQMASAQAGREAALVLLRAAVKLLVRATVLRELRVPDDTAPAELWALAAKLPVWPTATRAVGDAALQRVAKAVTDADGERYLSELSSSEQDALIDGLSTFGKLVAAPLEDDANAVRRVVFARRLRLACLLVAIGVAVVAAVGILVKSSNRALHAKVTVTENEPSLAIDPKQLVDGDRTNLGFHTSARRNATVIIDLGAVKSIHRIDVYNRADCCQERVTPLSVQVSSDGESYRRLARTERVFERWTIPAPAGMTARYVRLTHESAQYFHLSEVEVY
jgi:hypothetical protein